MAVTQKDSAKESPPRQPRPVDQRQLRRLVVFVFALGALASVVWLVVRPTGLALLAAIFLVVQAGLLGYMAHLQEKLRK